MSLDRLNDWLTLIANLGVIAGLVFVGLEIRQNTLVMERQIRVEYADNVHGQIAESDHLAPIVAKVVTLNRTSDFLEELGSEYNLTPEEVQRWWRYLFQTMLRDEADWLYDNDEGCPNLSFRLQFRDQQIVYEGVRQALDSGFVACVEAIRDGSADAG